MKILTKYVVKPFFIMYYYGWYFRTWNIYFIIVCSCYCVVHAVRLQFKHLCRRIDKQYKRNMQKLNNNPALCPVGILPRVAKKLTAFCHNPRHLYWRHMPLRYFTESCKTLQPLPQSSTTFSTTSLMDSGHSKRVQLSECLVGQHVFRWNH